jgi:Domain of unknown function (DUF4345)
MAIDQVLNVMGASVTIAMGLMGLLIPKIAAKITGLSATNKTAFAEFRATFGGMFVVMGLLPIWTGSAMAFGMVGCIWLGAAFGRLLSVLLDEGYKEVKNIVGIGFEAGIGLLLLAGSPYSKSLF